VGAAGTAARGCARPDGQRKDRAYSGTGGTLRIHGEIVNCDSVAMYREFDIGTAKPTASERARCAASSAGLRCPTERLQPGDMRGRRGKLEEIKARGHLPIVVGGTGLYLRALLIGSFRAAALGGSCANDWRDEPVSVGGELSSPHECCAVVDRAAAEKIHAKRHPRR